MCGFVLAVNRRIGRFLDELTGVQQGTRINLGVSVGALALAWVTSDPRLTSALVGPRTLDQFGVAVESLQLTLSTEERDGIAGRMQRAGGHPVQQGTGT